MAGMIQFVLALAFYPVIGLGLVIGTAQFYNWLRTLRCTDKLTPCRAKLVTGVLVAVAVWLMSGGFPMTVSLTSVGSLLTLALYAATLYLGGNAVYDKREAIRAWVESQFRVTESGTDASAPASGTDASATGSGGDAPAA